MASDAEYVASFLAQRTSGPVVLVGHSYGGFVITNAGNGGGDVRALVYADAFIPDEGENVFGANTAPSGPAAWKTLPSWAVIGTEDKVIPPDTQRHMAERAGATITEVAGSHVSMVSHPQMTIDAILAAVDAVGD